MDIIKGLGNANKIMNRMLWKAREKFGLKVHSINGGGLRNAIPRESFSIVCVPSDQLSDWKKDFENKAIEIKTEYASNDSDLKISFEASSSKNTVISNDLQDKITAAIYSAFNGIYRMSPDIEGLVQTSNNLAKVTVNSEICEVLCLTRSSLDSEKFDLSESLAASFESTNYPGMDMISFGPNIRGAHSPDEKCQISSVQKYWGYLLETLKRI